MEEEQFCPICGRELIPGTSINEHHLTPQRFKGKVTILIHKVCHDKIHNTFTDYELRDIYNTIESLISHIEIQKFIMDNNISNIEKVKLIEILCEISGGAYSNNELVEIKKSLKI